MAETEREVPFRGGGFAPVRWRGAAIVVFVALLCVWEVAVRGGAVSRLFLPAPSDVVAALRDLAESGQIWRHLGISLFRIAAGWSVGTLAGLAVGLAMGIWSLSRAVGLPLISALFPVPKIALLPLLILWLGIGECAKVATIALGVFFPTAIAAYSGVDSVPRNLIRMGQSFGLSHADVVRKIILPGALPSMLAGVRVSASIALILLVAAEMIGAEYGVGSFVLAAGNTMRTDQLLAGVAILSLLGLAIGMLLTALERRLLRWR